MSWTDDRWQDGRGDRFWRIEVEVGAPAADEGRTCRQVTDTVVRVAEAVRGDDVYHVIYRESGESRSRAVPVGPQVQAFGERFLQLASRSGLVGRTVVWLTLARGARLGEVMDPSLYDPEREGEPEGLLGGAGVRWAMASACERRPGVSVRIRLRLFVPEESRRVVEHQLERLRERLGRAGG